jgi:hypothetical protein
MCCRRAASTIAQKAQFPNAIKASFKRAALRRDGAGFGTLSSQSGSVPGSLGPLIFGWRPFFCALARPKCAAVLYLIVKAALSGVIVAAVSEIARRYPGWAGLVASLPLTSLLAMIWLYRDSSDPERVAELSTSTIWFFVPSVPLFIALPILIRSGVGFWASMALCIVGTLVLYAVWFWAAPRLGLKL